jgi:hypothetical protein
MDRSGSDVVGAVTAYLHAAGATVHAPHRGPPFGPEALVNGSLVSSEDTKLPLTFDASPPRAVPAAQAALRRAWSRYFW